MSARKDLAAALTSALPAAWRVIDHADSLDRIDVGRPVLMLWRESVTPSAVGTFAHQDNQMKAWLVVAAADPAAADDDLDDLLDNLIETLDNQHAITWTRAERGVLADTFAGYQIDLTYTTEKKGYLP